MKKFFHIVFFGILSFVNISWAAETTGIWRSSSPVLKSGKYYSIIQDRGRLSKAITASDGTSYLFSEKGAGTQPLIIIGTPSQILAEISKQSDKNNSIKNSIPELSSIYYGISKYKPGDRFVGTFPMQGFAQEFMNGFMGIFGGSSDLADVLKSVNDYSQAIAKYFVKSGGQAEKGVMLYELKISYLPEAGMTEYKERIMPFNVLLDQFRVSTRKP